MDDLEEALFASALESLNIEEYWPQCDNRSEWDDDKDEEFPIILCFYEQLLDHVQEHISCSGEETIRQAIHHLVSNYGKASRGKTPQDLNYENIHHCVAYLHRFAACHAALARSVLIRLFHVCPPAPLRRMLSLKQNLKILSVGGGPGCDVIGFLSALYGRHYGLEDLQVTVLDHGCAWGPVLHSMVHLLRQGKHGNASAIFSELKVRLNFVHAGIKDREMKEALRCTDIVLLVKVLSIIPDDEKSEILRLIVSDMKPGSFLIYIDCPFPENAFASVARFLEPAYIDNKTKFCFNYEVERFGFKNITMSQAHVRGYVRTFYAAQ